MLGLYANMSFTETTLKGWVNDKRGMKSYFYIRKNKMKIYRGKHVDLAHSYLSGPISQKRVSYFSEIVFTIFFLFRWNKFW